MSATETLARWASLLESARKQVKSECKTIDDLKKLMLKHSAQSSEAMEIEAKSRCDFAGLRLKEMGN
jgi:hypothetical protein